MFSKIFYSIFDKNVMDITKLQKKHVAGVTYIPGLCRRDYILREFSEDLILFFNRLFGSEDITLVLVNYLESEKVRLLKCKISRHFTNPQKMMTYWRIQEEHPIQPNVVQMNDRKFLQGWFRLIMKIEQNALARSIYDVVVELLKQKSNRLLAISNQYILIDDQVFDIDFPRSVMLW
jgi:hypothetical protein